MSDVENIILGIYSSSMSCVVFCCLFFIKVLSLDFFGSQNVLTWTDAENYCNEHCNSSLISIHSSSENTELQTFCDVMNNTEAEDCWIGITDAAEEDTWIWSDGSTVDYGSNISGGVLPWGLNQPNNEGNQDCGQLYSKTNPSYEWDDDYCTNYKHLLCNQCYPSLSKYIIVNISLNQSAANHYCRSTFGTELATIQSEDDYQEAKLLCNYSGSCLIGLNGIEGNGSFEWEDGTQNIDFWMNSNGTVGGYPWDSGEPNSAGYEDCVHLRKEYSFLANDLNCKYTDMFLCNSALDNYICDINVQRELWNDLSCNWTWNNKSDGCGVTVVKSDEFDGCVTWLGNSAGLNPYKLWTDLVVEVTLAMQTLGNGAGILIRAENASPINDVGQQYYIGISFPSAVVFGKMNDGWYLLSNNLSFVLTLNVYYTIRCELVGGTFLIYVDNVLYITHYDSSYAYGSVGLRAYNQTAIYKKLFISGVEYQPTMEPTANPTIFPTEIPTNDPTEQPSVYFLGNEPTYNPSSHPTLNSANIEFFSFSSTNIIIIIVGVVFLFIVLVIGGICLLRMISKYKNERSLQNFGNMVITNGMNDNFGNNNGQGMGGIILVDHSNAMLQMMQMQNIGIQENIALGLDMNSMNIIPDVRNIEATTAGNPCSISVDNEDEEGNTSVGHIEADMNENYSYDIIGGVVDTKDRNAP